MMGKGVHRENFQPQSCSGKKARKMGQWSGDFENIVIIDGDDDLVDDVVIIGVEEFMHKKVHGSSVPSRDRLYMNQSVISIDDDESDDELIAEGVGELDSDASSSIRFFGAPSRMQNSVSIMQQSKCREAFSAKATGRNRYGLDLSEIESSESDCSDCEVLEFCEQWKKASFKRKRHVYDDQSCCDEHPSLRSDNDNFSQAKSNCATFDEMPVSCDDLLPHAQDGGHNASNGTDIINEREKFKETDEYKRANEEEWASRKRQLQIQAEEAQRLRKRKKAETKRLLDMQRRQKERVEEVREIQKKDEEFLNMKEKLWAEIQQGLNKLEMQCRDMTSLLCGLGIHVGGGFIPFPNEVQAAYKRALFKFHPDRASKTDVREQVEAEEKFKLITRMKEKFLLTSCL